MLVCLCHRQGKTTAIIYGGARNLSNSSMTSKQKYFRLLSHVCEALPTSAVDAVLRADRDYPLGATALAQVRVGRTINLKALVALVRASLPDFQIPEELLPAPAEKLEAPLFSA